ncbi:MAG: pyridoxal-phosphate dependent enzyme, partial [Sulfolobales archaeon]
IAVQTRSFHPIYTAMKGGELEPEEENLADGISIKRPPRLREIVDAVNDSKGDVVVVSNQEIKRALKELISRGMIVEPTSAVSLAGLLRSVESGSVFERAMVILTGSGLKVVQRMIEIVQP